MMLRKLFAREGRWTAVVVAAIALFLVANFAVAPVTGARVDMTENKLFTLSEGTRNVLAGIEDPITLEFYFSTRLGNEIPTYGNFATRVRDMLREFETVSGGRLRFEEIDPAPYSEMEDQAVAAGMQPVPFDQHGEKVYFGITGRTDGATRPTGDDRGLVEEVQTDRRTIPFFQIERDQFLEYDLARVIAAIDNPRRPLVGVWTGRPLFGDPQAALLGQTMPNYLIVEHAQELFDMRQVWNAEGVTDDLDVLLLAHPGGLEPWDHYAIDQYLMRGGNLLVFLDPFNEQAQRETDAGRLQLRRSNLEKLTATWGVEMQPDTLVADMNLARLINVGEREGRVIPAPYVTSLRLGPDNLSRNDPVTADIERVIMESAGRLRPLDGATTTFEPLITTTERSQLIDIAEHRGSLDIQKMAEEFQPSGEVQVLAARISGPVRSAFPDGPPSAKPGAAPAAENDTGEQTVDQRMLEQAEAQVRDEIAAERLEKAPPHRTESERPVNIILVADADMLEDSAWVQRREFYGRRFGVPVAGNGDLLVNALENLSGSTELMTLRSRGTAHRPFTLVNDIRQAADAQYRTEEQRLMRRMQEMERKLAELREGPAPGAEDQPATDPEEAERKRQAEIASFTEELLSTRRQLREVQFKLREEIDQLETRLQIANIAAMPVLVALVALALGWARLRRRRRAVALHRE